MYFTPSHAARQERGQKGSHLPTPKQEKEKSDVSCFKNFDAQQHSLTHAHDSFLCNNHQRTHHESTQICSFRRSLAMLYISCLQPTGVSPALNNRRRASSSSYVSQQKTLMKKKKKEEESAACQFTFLLDKPGCMDARMDEDEPCDVNLECPLEPFDISKCLKRHKGVLKMGVNHAVRFTLNAEKFIRLSVTRVDDFLRRRSRHG